MNTLARCPNCGITLPADAPAGLCPKCLVQAGLESEHDAPLEPQPTVSSPASAGFSPPTVEELASRFPQLEILELVGRGGMGAVYKARQKGLDRIVAVKILPPEVGRDPSFAQRFTREARALARLSHPNIVAVHDFGQSGGLFYFVMEFIDGTNLRQAMLAGRLQPQQALAVVPQICDALQYAHDEGVVHRDIKPENILLDKRGRVKIADFGLSKLVAGGEATPELTLTGTHQVMGTVRYMAPEQMEGTKAVDHRADIYSLGVVFYEMLTGELPLGRFAPPSRKVQVDVRLDEVVLRALEKEPQRRYQQASEVKTDVEAIAQAAPPGRQPTADTSTASGKGAQLPAFTAGAGPKLLAIALSLAFGGLLVLVGITLILLGFVWLPEGGWRWGIVAGGGGVLLGGLGAIFGTWRNYLRFRGADDGMSDAEWNALDTFFLLVALTGLVMAAAGGVYWSRLGIGAALTLLILGTMVGVNGLWFSIWRWGVRRAARFAGARDRLDVRLLLLAMGMLLGAVSMIGGLALAIIGFVYQPGGPDQIGGWLGGACGFFFGGAGGLVGAWNAYRQLEGAEDFWASGEVTWFDLAIIVMGILGLALFAAGVWGPEKWPSDLRWGLGIIGAAVIVHVAAFGLIRSLVLRGARQEAERRRERGSESRAVSKAATPAVLSPPQAAPDGLVFLRLSVVNVLLWLLWAALLAGLQWGYVSGAKWYFQKELPYEYLNVGWGIVSVMFAYFFIYWWYLLAKSPQTPRSFSDAFRCLQTPDRRALSLWIPGGAFLVVWIGIMVLTMALANDDVQSTTLTALTIAAPLAAAGGCWWAYRERIPQLLRDRGPQETMVR